MLLKLKNFISVSTLLVSASILMGFVITPAVFAVSGATFTATDNQTVGNGQSWYSPTYATQLANVGAGTTEVVYYLNGISKVTESFSSGNTGFQIATSSLANGTYHLTAVLYNAAGQTSTVTALDGNSSLTFTVSNAPSATFTATDNQTVGTATSVGATFSTQLTNESSGITQTVYYLDNVTAGVNTKVGGVDGFQTNVSTLSNGTHTLTATVQDSTGNTGKVTAIDGNSSLTFTVNNSSSTSPPASTGNSTCTAKQQDLNVITTRIVNRSETQLQTIDSLVKATEGYYSKQPQTINNYTQVTQKLVSDDNTAQSEIITMVDSSVINCNSSLSTQLTTFTNSVTAAQTGINNYINDAQQLVKQVEAQQ